MKLSEEHQFGRVISQTTSGNWYEVRTGRTINHQKLKVRTEKPYDNRNTKDILTLRLKSAKPYGRIVLLRISLCRGSAVYALLQYDSPYRGSIGPVKYNRRLDRPRHLFQW